MLVNRNLEGIDGLCIECESCIFYGSALPAEIVAQAGLDSNHCKIVFTI